MRFAAPGSRSTGNHLRTGVVAGVSAARNRIWHVEGSGPALGLATRPKGHVGPTIQLSNSDARKRTTDPKWCGPGPTRHVVSASRPDGPPAPTPPGPGVQRLCKRGQVAEAVAERGVGDAGAQV